MNQINVMSKLNEEVLSDVREDFTQEGVGKLRDQIDTILAGAPEKVNFFNQDKGGYLRKFPGTEETLIQILEPTEGKVLEVLDLLHDMTAVVVTK